MWTEEGRAVSTLSFKVESWIRGGKSSPPKILTLFNEDTRLLIMRSTTHLHLLLVYADVEDSPGGSNYAHRELLCCLRGSVAVK